jgi:hypothetical protein
MIHLEVILPQRYPKTFRRQVCELLLAGESVTKPTGSKSYDAMLAGIVGYACATHRVLVPSWVNDADCFLDEFWFVSGMKSLQADVIVQSPISLKRCGSF